MEGLNTIKGCKMTLSITLDTICVVFACPAILTAVVGWNFQQAAVASVAGRACSFRKNDQNCVEPDSRDWPGLDLRDSRDTLPLASDPCCLKRSTCV